MVAPPRLRTWAAERGRRVALAARLRRIDDPLDRAIAAARAGDLHLAESEARRAHADSPSARTRAWLATVLAELDRPDEARGLVPDAGKVGRARRPRQALLRALLRSRRYDEALELFDRWASDDRIAERFVAGRGASADPRLASALREAPPADELFVFVHLPFTGGTSLQVAFDDLFLPAERFNVRRRPGLRDLAAWERMPAGSRAAVRYVHLHHPVDVAAFGRPVRRFVVLRDPVTHLLSGFQKRRATATVLPTRGGADRLTDHVAHCEQAGLRNVLARQLLALHPDHRGAVADRSRRRRLVRYEDDLACYAVTAGLDDEVLLRQAVEVLDHHVQHATVVERLEAGYLEVVGALGVPLAPRLPHRGRSRDEERQPLTDELRARIEGLSPVDVELHRRILQRVDGGEGSQSVKAP